MGTALEPDSTTSDYYPSSDEKRERIYLSDKKKRSNIIGKADQDMALRIQKEKRKKQRCGLCYGRGEGVEGRKGHKKSPGRNQTFIL